MIHKRNRHHTSENEDVKMPKFLPESTHDGSFVATAAMIVMVVMVVETMVFNLFAWKAKYQKSRKEIEQTNKKYELLFSRTDFVYVSLGMCVCAVCMNSHSFYNVANINACQQQKTCDLYIVSRNDRHFPIVFFHFLWFVFAFDLVFKRSLFNQAQFFVCTTKYYLFLLYSWVDVCVCVLCA